MHSLPHNSHIKCVRLQTIPAADAKRAKMDPPNLIQEINDPPQSPVSEIDLEGPTEEPDINDDDTLITNSK